MQKITKLYAFISSIGIPDDREGIMAYQNPKGMWVPMVCANKKHVEEMIPIADKVVIETGIPYAIKTFNLSGE